MVRLSHRWILIAFTALSPSVLSFFSNATASAAQTVLTFDDISAGSFGVQMPPGYGGVSWPSNVGVFVTQHPYAPQSLPNSVVFNVATDNEIAETIVSFVGGPKVFDGAYFSGYDPVYFNLYNGATLVSTSSVLNLGSNINGGSGSGPIFLASGHSGLVTRVGIVLDEQLAVMDNFTFEQVPEPTSLLLLFVGSGLLGSSVLVARRTRSRSFARG